MRKYVRRPIDIPIQYHIKDVVADREEYLKNVSEGGICLRSNVFLKPGAVIVIEIPLLDPIFKAEGRIVWCNKKNDDYETGVEFILREDQRRLRMVEQVCYIEHYKREVFQKEGRKLSGEEAAIEWIRKFAKDFPEI